MTQVVGERIDLTFAISNGPPQSLVLEIKRDNDTTTRVPIGDLELVGSTYRYSFVAQATDVGWWRFRFTGVDALGVEFAWPQDRRWDVFDIE